jgi:patatin-like phospholipase/acyl hydrolase
LINKLKRETVAQRIELYKKASIMHVEPNSEHYNILSIDGGGIRGLIPAMWLSELERRTQLSVSSMFRMMAGTSTGATIAAGLSLPDKYNVRRPHYRAVDLVELYTTHASRVFSRSSAIKRVFRSASKYTDEGRKSLFEDYFEETRLSEAISDLLITAVQSGNPTT